MYTRGHYCNESDAKPFLNMFSLTGVCEEVLEKYIDALSAVSGSGVAFVSYWSTHENTFIVTMQSLYIQYMHVVSGNLPIVIVLIIMLIQ